MIKYLFLFILSGIFTLFITPLIKYISFKLKAIDFPNARKIHTRPVPRLGGVAIFIVFNSILVFLAKFEFLGINLVFLRTIHYEWIFLGGFFAFIIGLLDDIERVPPSLKLLFQIIGALIVTIGCCRIDVITTPLGRLEFGFMAVPVSVFWIVGVTNAINLLDGMDGLAGGTVVIASVALFGISFINGNIEIAVLSLILGGTTLGFLRYNFYPASIFLGDSGAYFLGFMLGMLAILGSLKHAAALTILIPILILGLPLMDTVLSIIRRLLKSFHIVKFDQEHNRYKFFFIDDWSLFSADKGHIHHRLLRLGFSQKKAVLILYAVSAFLGAVAFISVYLKSANSALILLIMGIGMYVAIKKLPYEEVQILRNGTLLTVFDSPIVTSRFLQVFVDIALIIGVYYVSFYFRFEQGFNGELKRYFLETTPLVVLIKFLSFYINGLYKRSWRYMSIPEVVKIFRAVFVGSGISALCLLVIPGFGLRSRTIIFIDLTLLFLFVVGVRSSYRLLEYFKFFERSEQGLRHVLICGANKDGVNALRELTENGEQVKVIGFVDDDKSKVGNIIFGCPVLGDLGSIQSILKEKSIAEIILTSKVATKEVLSKLKEICKGKRVKLKIFQSSFDSVVVEDN